MRRTFLYGTQSNMIYEMVIYNLYLPLNQKRGQQREQAESNDSEMIVHVVHYSSSLKALRHSPSDVEKTLNRFCTLFWSHLLVQGVNRLHS